MSVQKYSLPQQSWASGVSAAVTIYAVIRGKCEQIAVKVNDNTGNKTVTLNIKDNDNSGQLFNQAAIPENATTVYKATSDASDFDAFISDGKLVFTITPSGDPGASGMTVDVDLYLIEA